MSRRTQRIEDQMQMELANLLLTEVRDPRLQQASIVNVEVSIDLTTAKVAISMMADEAERQAALEALERASGFFRSRLAKRLKHMRRVPELHFRIDRGAEHSQRIQEILENLE